MKKTLLALFTLCLTAISYAQDGGVAMDTIILVSSREIVGKVQTVGSSKISYLNPTTKKVEELTRKQVHKILYSTGRVEAFNSMAFQEVDATSFQSIVVTENPADVDGLYAYGAVQAKSGTSSKTAKAAEKNARIRLQRRAAAMGAMYVLITKSETRGGYKEVPTHFYEGVAYGVDPPKDGEKK